MTRSGSEQADLLRAIEFAAHKHRDQRRKGVDASPYINHPIQVAALIASEAGTDDLVTLMAAVLHDTVEDTDTSFEELDAEFGQEVRDLVAEVTDDKSLEKAERKRLQVVHAPQLSDRARLIKLADKICNVRDIGQAPPAHWGDKRKLQYFDWAIEVVNGCRSVSPRLAELFDMAVDESRRKALASAESNDESPGYASSPCYAHELDRST